MFRLMTIADVENVTNGVCRREASGKAEIISATDVIDHVMLLDGSSCCGQSKRLGDCLDAKERSSPGGPSVRDRALGRDGTQSSHPKTNCCPRGNTFPPSPLSTPKLNIIASHSSVRRPKSAEGLGTSAITSIISSKAIVT